MRTVRSTTPTVTKIAAGSPAEKAGFKVGDLLTSINGIGFDAKNAEALKGVMENGFKIGEIVRYTAKRDDQIVTLAPVLAAIPDASLKRDGRRSRDKHPQVEGEVELA